MWLVESLVLSYVDIILNKSNMYKCANLTVGITTAISLVCFGGALYSELIWLVGLTYGLFGFC